MDRNIRFLGFGAGVRALGVSMVYPFISLYLKNRAGIGYAEIGVLLVVVGIVPLVVSPFGGMITDRLGRRRVFLASLAAEAVSVLLIALSMRSDSLAGIIVFGAASYVAGGALAGPSLAAYVADIAVGSERTLGYTWQRIGFNAGFTAGTALGGFLIGYAGFSEVGILSAAILGFSTGFLAFSLTPSPYDLRLSRTATLAGEATEKLKSVRESVAILARDRRFLIFSVAMLLASLVYAQWSVTFPLFINTVLGLPYWVIGVALSLNGAIVIFGQTPTTRLMLGRRHTTSAVLALLLMVAAFLMLGGLSSLGVGTVLASLVFVVLLTVGENLGAIPSMTLPSNLAPESERGSYNGAFGTISGIGNVFAPLVGGLVLAASTNPLLVWGALAIPVVPAVILLLWLGSRLPAEANRV